MAAPFLPILVKPLSDDATVPMSVSDLFAVIASDPVASRFFEKSAEVKRADVLVGELAELDADGRESGPSTVGYVVRGGSSTCFFGGPAGGSETGEVSCTSIVVVDAKSRSVIRVSEVEG